MSRVCDANAANYLLAPNIAAYNLTANHAFSAACWVKLTGTGVHQTFLQKGDGGSNSDWMLWLLNSGVVYCSFNNATSNFNTGATTITDTTTWHHLALTVGAGGGIIYIDGVSRGTTGGIPNSTNTYAFGVGGPSQFGVPTAKAKIEKPTYWNTELSPTDIGNLQTSVTPESYGTCVAAWHLDSTSLADSTANVNTTVVQGTVAYDSDTPIAVAALSVPVAMRQYRMRWAA